MTSILDHGTRNWNDATAGAAVIARNVKYSAMSSLGYNAENAWIPNSESLTRLISLIGKYGEDGKEGLRFFFRTHRKKRPVEEFGWMRTNTVIYNVQATFRVKEEDRPAVWDTRFMKKEQLIKELQSAKVWQQKMELEDKKTGRTHMYKSEWLGKGTGSLQLVFGTYRNPSCTGCGRPHYEHVVTQNSFHVCPYCGMQYKHSNIQLVPQLRMNEEGVQVGFHHAPQGMKLGENWAAATKKRGRHILARINVDYKSKCIAKISTMVGSICEHIKIDTGDSYGHIRKWAWNRYEAYADWLFRQGRWEGLKNKMGAWQIAAVFVWYAILSWEQKINQSTTFSLSKVSLAAQELQDGDTYIPNYARRLKRRKIAAKVEGKSAPVKETARVTRKVTMSTIHRYATAISEEWPGYESVIGVEIPSASSIEVSRGVNTTREEAVTMYAELRGKLSHKIFLPKDSSWDMDIIIDKKFILVEPDLDGKAFEQGLRKNDIIRTINGEKCPTTVDETFEMISKFKQESKTKAITLTILR